MALVKFPSRALDSNRISPYVNSIFDSLFDDSSLATGFTKSVPAINISEDEDAFTIELAAPGLQKSDFIIQLDKGEITVSVEQKEEAATTGKQYSKREFSYSAFSRSFTLPETIDYNNIDAAYTDGILYVTIGKKEESKFAKRVLEVK